MSKPPIKSRSRKEPENLSALRKGLAQALTVSKAELDARLRAARERKQKEGRTRYPS
jgi:hypothetical protein